MSPSAPAAANSAARSLPCNFHAKCSSRFLNGAWSRIPCPVISVVRGGRGTLLRATGQDAEKSFKKTREVDRLIDLLKEANPRELDQIVVENVLSLDENFWTRLAARTDTCKSDDDKKDYEELAGTVMNIVDRLVRKTKEKIEISTDVLKSVISPVMNCEEEVTWPPNDPHVLVLMEKEIAKREEEGELDEGFLSEVNAQLRTHTILGQTRWR